MEVNELKREDRLDAREICCDMMDESQINKNRWPLLDNGAVNLFPW
jgi:hypothetical protein